MRARSRGRFGFERLPEHKLMFNPETNPKDRSLTQQQFKKSCDINQILDKYMRTGELLVNSRSPKYGDFADMPDFAEVSRRVAAVRSNFSDLPSKVRSFFGNDPQALIDFCADPKNTEEAIKMGLIDRADAPKAAPDAPHKVQEDIPSLKPPTTPA